MARSVPLIRTLLLLALVVLLLSLSGLFRVSLALSGHLTDKPGLTTRITLVLMQEKLSGAGDPHPRLLPKTDTLSHERVQLPLWERPLYLLSSHDLKVRRDPFIDNYVTALFRSNSNFV